ncbi:hypothetical protein VCB98_08475 [Gammaproteobacteria bacterium AB-CW1]|uniref:WD40 repeat domain-containing protein n=1 Tax=Natronospira elongata TaxID=3110268 RepID=A0AAP6JFT9_9GAMM|nr:hypothetical protein [Gammaproteobacteria bacterium AB-CW1]
MLKKMACLYCLALMLLLSACFDGEESSFVGPDDDEDEMLDSDTSEFSGELAWHFSGSGSSGIALWRLEDSELRLTERASQNQEALRLPSLARNQAGLTFTVDQTTETDTLPRVIHVDSSGNDRQSLPRDAGADTRLSWGASVDADASTIAFAEDIRSVASDPESSVSRGVGIWDPIADQVETLVTVEGDISCTDINAAGTFVIFNDDGQLFRSPSSGANPVPVPSNHADLRAVIVDQPAAGPCPFQLSDDGNRVAFMGELENQDGVGAFFAQMDAGAAQRVAPDLAGDLVAWRLAGNGERGVLLSRDESGDNTIWRMFSILMINPGQTTQVTSITQVDGAPDPGVDISADGQTLVLSGRDQDGPFLELSDFSGENSVRIDGNSETMGEGRLIPLF